MRPRPHRETWLARPPRATVPSQLRPWLTDPGSLTARIRARCDALAVRVLSQTLSLPHPDEAALLGLRRGQLAWLREVLLIADGKPVVFARTVLPRRGLRGAWRMFRGFGAKPLGAALFADPRIERQPLACARLDQRDPRYRRVLAVLGSAAGSVVEPLQAATRGAVEQADASVAEGAARGNAAPLRIARHSLWARRSVFRLHGRPLLVGEIFLPAILELPR